MAIITINNFDFHSYATVEQADIYFSAKYGSNWDEVEDKEQLLITATKQIDSNKFVGTIADRFQHLKFPRLICGVEVNPEYLLIECCCEIANSIYNSNVDNISTPNAENIKSISVGDTSITYRDGASIETDLYYALAKPIIKKYLGDFLKGNVRIIL